MPGRRISSIALTWFLIFVPCLFARQPLQKSAGVLRNFLVDQIGFSQGDLGEMEGGEPIVKLLKTSESREIAAFGIVRLDAPQAFFVQRFTDIAGFKKSGGVEQAGKFSNPPSLRDLDRLTIDDQDLDELKKCDPGSCGVRLSSDAIDKFSKDINWQQKDAPSRAEALYKGILLDAVREYIAKGDDGLGSYDDHKNSVSLAKEFSSILQSSSYIKLFAPQLYSYLQNFPASKWNAAHEFIYWSKEKFGLKPVISLTHAIISSEKTAAGNTVVIASRQIYASHYFDASLGLTILADSIAADGNPVTYLIYLNRSRSDSLSGGFNPIKRSIVAGRVRQGMEKQLRLVKSRIETAAAANKMSTSSGS